MYKNAYVWDTTTVSEVFNSLFGKESCTPNMHLACHLWNNLFDYGPLAAFWAYSFECYTGIILENIKTSWNGKEKQIIN